MRPAKGWLGGGLSDRQLRFKPDGAIDMFSKFIGAAIVWLVMFAALACRSSIPAPTLTQPTVPTKPRRR